MTLLATGEVACSHGEPACAECIEAEGRWLVETAKTCRNGCGVTCGDRPCPGCMAGGECDGFECRCDDEPDDHDEDSDDPA